MSLLLFDKNFSVGVLNISSAVPCHHKRSIIPTLPLYIKEEMKVYKNVKEIGNQVSNPRTFLISICTGDNIPTKELDLKRSIKQ
jgi:hypothetical protein